MPPTTIELQTQHFKHMNQWAKHRELVDKIGQLPPPIDITAVPIEDVPKPPWED